MSTNRGIGLVDPVIRPGRNPSASRMETSDRLVRNIVGVGSTRVSYRNGKIAITGGAQAIKEMFGIKSISGATVTIYAGKIWIGKTEQAAAETPLTLNTDSYVGWEYAFGGGLTIKNFGSTFVQDDGYIRKPLYLFTYTAPVAPATVGSISLSTGCHMCEVFPANWGSY